MSPVLEDLQQWQTLTQDTVASRLLACGSLPWTGPKPSKLYEDDEHGKVGSTLDGAINAWTGAIAGVSIAPVAVQLMYFCHGYVTLSAGAMAVSLMSAKKCLSFSELSEECATALSATLQKHVSEGRVLAQLCTLRLLHSSVRLRLGPWAFEWLLQVACDGGHALQRFAAWVLFVTWPRHSGPNNVSGDYIAHRVYALSLVPRLLDNLDMEYKNAHWTNLHKCCRKNAYTDADDPPSLENPSLWSRAHALRVVVGLKGLWTDRGRDFGSHLCVDLYACLMRPPALVTLPNRVWDTIPDDFITYSLLLAVVDMDAVPAEHAGTVLASHRVFPLYNRRLRAQDWQAVLTLLMQHRVQPLHVVADIWHHTTLLSDRGVSVPVVDALQKHLLLHMGWSARWRWSRAKWVTLVAGSR